MYSNRLQVNADKTELLRCSSIRKLSQLPSCSVSVAGFLVCPVNAVRDLGVFIDNDLGAATHVRRTVMLHFASFVDTSLTTASVRCWCFLCTQDDYGDFVLVGLQAYLQQSLQSVLNAAAWSSPTSLVIITSTTCYIIPAQLSVDAHFQLLQCSSGTSCYLTSNHPRLCLSCANI